jgi:hypothetical protein
VVSAGVQRLAFDVPDVAGMLGWVNSQNRAQMPKYYCVVAEGQQMAAVVTEAQFYGDMLYAMMTGMQGRSHDHSGRLARRHYQVPGHRCGR